MERSQQLKIATDLIESLKSDVLGKLEGGLIPESWDGVELRQFIVDKANETLIFGTGMTRKRLREYRNDVVVRNL